MTVAGTKPAEDKMQSETDAELKQRVISALEDPRYQWRSIDGISEQTDLPGAQVRRIIEEMEDQIVRSSIPDEKGRSLYTTRQHYRKTHGFGDRLLNALADRVA